MKKNRIYKAMMISFGVSLLLACSEDFLDRKPLDTLVTGNYYKTSEGIQSAANAIYAPLGEEGYNGKSIWMIGDGASDDAQPNGTDPDYIPIDQFTLASDNPRNADLWQVVYRMVALANIVIDNIEGNSASEEILNQAKGEALMLRGYGYFSLVRLYSDVPLVLDNMGSAELDGIVRSSAFEVFNRVIQDLTEASEILPTKGEYGESDDIGRANKDAALGILAKVYMTLAGDLSMYNTEVHPNNSSDLRSIADPQTCYSRALDLCNTIIASPDYVILPDFKDLFTRDGDNCAESIWQLQFIGCGSRHGSGNMMQAFWAPWQSEITGGADGWGSHSPHEDLARCFYDNPDDLIMEGNNVDSTVLPPADLRFYHTLMFPGIEYTELPSGVDEIPYALPYAYGASGFAAKKYVIGKGTDVCDIKAPNNAYLLRLADILLLKAECLVELNRPAEAASVLDPIRTRAGKEMISTSLGQEEMRTAVRLERRRELALEQSRWFDILRWGIAEEVLATQEIILPAERRLFPIPSTEISLNPNLVQNATY